MSDIASSAAARLLVAIVGLTVLAMPRVSSQAPEKGFATDIVDGREVVAGEAIVRFRGGARIAARAALLDVEASEPVGGGLRRIRSRSIGAEQLVSTLRALPEVAYAEPNYVARADAVPNDPFFSRQPGLLNLSVPGADVHATGAWDIATGSNAGVVAVVDSGIDYRHPDLVANLWTAPAAFTVTLRGVPITCPAGVHGFNAIAMTCDPLDDHGHGTAMAGVIGARGNNGRGVAGMSWKASLMALKFLGAGGWGSYADALTAMDFALQVKDIFAAGRGAHVRVMSNSWSGSGYSQALFDQIARAAAHDVLVVASAGNDASDNDVTPKYPASYAAPNVVAVAATTSRDTLETYSNVGASSVHLGAPASTYSTARGSAYGTTGGTSASAALVSGAASLVLSACALTTPELKSALLSSVDLLPSLGGATVTGGRLNVLRAIQSCHAGNAAPAVVLTSPRAGDSFTALATVTLAASALDGDGAVADVAFYAGTTLIGRDTRAPFGVRWSGVAAGSYTLTAVATDNGGATGTSAPVTITVVPAAAALPAPWSTQDIGQTGATGSASFSGGTFIAEGAGADVWRSSDQFRYVYRPLRGDGEIVARVSFVENVDPWTKAGVMIRETLSPGSPHAFMIVSAGKGLAFQRRTAAGGSTAHTSGGSTSSAPYWIKLRRTGGTIAASASPDGVAWTLVGRATFPMADPVHVGFAVSSHRHGVLATAAFDSVTLSGWLPGGWDQADVGAVTAGGRTVVNGTSFELTGSGADVWGTRDAFHIAYRAVTGDAQIVARVASVEHVHAWTKAGVMIRESLSPDSPHGFMLVSPGKGVAFQRRLAAGALTTHTAGGAGVAPVWLKLVRTGSTLTASRSPDGVTWTVVGRDTVPLGSTVYVGLAVSSHSTRAATAVFDQIAVTP